jgi:hypothetical protein
MEERQTKLYILSNTTKDLKFLVEKTIIKNRGFETIGYEIGGKDTKCLNITVTNIIKGDEYEDMLKSFMKPNIASFNSIKYAKECRIGGIELDKSSGTRNLMLSGFAYVKSVSDHIDYFSLTDASSVQCGDQSISLPILSILKHTKTWYEYHFNATLEDLSLKFFYDKGIKTLKEITIENVLKLVTSFSNEIINIDQNFEKIDKKSKFLDYIQKLDKTKLCKTKLCKIAGSPAIHRLLIELFEKRDPLTQTKWIIPIDKLNLPTNLISSDYVQDAGKIKKREKNRENFSLTGGHLFR